MIVSSVLTPKGNPGNPEAPRKFFAQAKSNGELTLRKLSKKIAESSITVSDTDVLADPTKMLHRHLSYNKIVYFGNFSSFQVAITSTGSNTAEKFNKGGKVTFRPGIDLREMFAMLKYGKTK
jgi:hypothetical protein